MQQARAFVPIVYMYISSNIHTRCDRRDVYGATCGSKRITPKEDSSQQPEGGSNSRAAQQRKGSLSTDKEDTPRPLARSL